MKSEILKAAQAAVQWAKRPSLRFPERTNYAQLLEDVMRAATTGNTPVLLYCPGVQAAHWPFLSRMLIMDVPELAEAIHPKYVGDLDCPSSAAMMQLVFLGVTGRFPTVRSWRHACAEYVGKKREPEKQT